MNHAVFEWRIARRGRRRLLVWHSEKQIGLFLKLHENSDPVAWFLDSDISKHAFRNSELSSHLLDEHLDIIEASF